ncbi:YcnI family protein [Microbacterium sp. SSM24]|uniref:YcnI family copper-binding membrane protein n=1 Tax=Microbacterium sp. SSM24 TaxID=2991714 RepID=UPI0022263ED6|nr:YcnI family protein [Microbacterium sp. SSM24]MCW3493945.1 YcnI family protein [Microbacterium sp. SSM24]
MTTTRFRRTLLLGAAAGVAIALGVPLAASAHVHVDPGTASAGSTETLTFAFSHGCDGSPTSALVIDVPEGVGNVTPVVQGGWTITRELSADGVPTQVTFTSDVPVEDGLKATVSLDALFDESAADTSIAFPVTQVCVDGETAWTEVAEDGQTEDDLESPAPVVEVGPVSADGDGHGDHGDAAEGDGHDEGSGDSSEAAASDSGDPVARWLAAGGLVAGIAALVVVLVRGRSRKS